MSEKGKEPVNIVILSIPLTLCSYACLLCFDAAMKKALPHTRVGSVLKSWTRSVCSLLRPKANKGNRHRKYSSCPPLAYPVPETLSFSLLPVEDKTRIHIRWSMNNLVPVNTLVVSLLLVVAIPASEHKAPTAHIRVGPVFSWVQQVVAVLRHNE